MTGTATIRPLNDMTVLRAIGAMRRIPGNVLPAAAFGLSSVGVRRTLVRFPRGILDRGRDRLGGRIERRAHARDRAAAGQQRQHRAAGRPAPRAARRPGTPGTVPHGPASRSSRRACRRSSRTPAYSLVAVSERSARRSCRSPAPGVDDRAVFSPRATRPPSLRPSHSSPGESGMQGGRSRGVAVRSEAVAQGGPDGAQAIAGPVPGFDPDPRARRVAQVDPEADVVVGWDGAAGGLDALPGRHVRLDAPNGAGSRSGARRRSRRGSANVETSGTVQGSCALRSQPRSTQIVQNTRPK